MVHFQFISEYYTSQPIHNLNSFLKCAIKKKIEDTVDSADSCESTNLELPSAANVKTHFDIFYFSHCDFTSPV